MTKKVKKSLGKLIKNLKSFSLVELIIVIAIIAILSVAGFMTLTKWIGKARDSRRVSDLQTIQKALTYNYMDSSSEDYPLPDGKQLITGSNGEQLWYQGIFGDEAVKEVSSLSKAPKDPNGDNYEYSVTVDQKTWEAYAILEDGDKVSYIDNVYAGEGKVIKRGNYKGYIMGETGSTSMLYNPASMYLTSGTQLTTGSSDDVYQENENVGASQMVTGMVVTGGTNVSLIADNFGITEDEVETAVNDAANGGSINVESNDEGGDSWTCGNDINITVGGTGYTYSTSGFQMSGDSEMYTACWTTENMRHGTQINGGTDPTNDDTIEKWCYDNDFSNCETYGGLYSWDEAMGWGNNENTGNSVCGKLGDGWYLPSTIKFTALKEGLNCDSNCGWNSNNSLKNLNGLIGSLPGARNSDGSYYYKGNSGEVGFRWFSSPEDSGSARRFYFRYDRESISTYRTNKNYGLSIICIRD